jgi:hypothetical protein
MNELHRLLHNVTDKIPLKAFAQHCQHVNFKPAVERSHLPSSQCKRL